MGVQEHLQALRSKNVDQRVKAARALGSYSESAVVDSLIIALGDPVKKVRQEAAAALGRIGDSNARDRLVQLAKDKDQSSITRAVVVEALDKIGNLPAGNFCREHTSIAENDTLIVSRGELGRDIDRALSLITEKDFGLSVVGLSKDSRRLLFVTRQSISEGETELVHRTIEAGQVQIGHYLAILPSYPLFVLKAWIYSRHDSPFSIEAYPDVGGPGLDVLQYIADGGVIRACFFVFDTGNVPILNVGCLIDTKSNNEIAASIVKAEFHLNNTLEEAASLSQAYFSFHNHPTIEARHFFLLERAGPLKEHSTAQELPGEDEKEVRVSPLEKIAETDTPLIVTSMELVHYALLRTPISSLEVASKKERILVDVPQGDVAELTDGFALIEGRVTETLEVDIDKHLLKWAIELLKLLEGGKAATRSNPWVILEYLLSAHEIAPAYPLVLMNLGVTYALCGEGEQAQYFLEQALQLSPDNLRIQKNRDAVRSKFIP
jgi:hypothetical protein